MIHYKSKAEIELIRQSCVLVEEALALVASVIRPGGTTLQLNNLAEQFLLDNKSLPSFKGYLDYPFASCISVNAAVVHGFPTNTEIREGDIISVDIGAYKNGFHGDSAYTFAVGPIPDDVKKLLTVTKASLYKGIEKAVNGGRVGDIGYAIQQYTEREHGYGVVRDLVGHGVGRKLHEDPQVPNYGKRGTKEKLKEGMVIAIEPMINLGTKNVYHAEDGWTIMTQDGKPAAHYEHTICVQKGRADILSSFKAIEAAEKANTYLVSDY
jgi:methionyl aminopeptidase